MKPIQTNYKHVIYRSRLEAKWAVFFDSLRFDFEYEPFEISYNGNSWLPDFIVHTGFEFGYGKYPLIEIKPIKPNEEYVKYLTNIRNPSKSDILICVGSPDFEQPNGIWITNQWDLKNRKMVNTAIHGFICIRCDECGRFNVNHYGNGQFSQDILSLACERYHNLDTGHNNHASEFAKNYRFDLQ